MALVERDCGVRLAVRSAGKYLKRWRYTAQKSLNKAYEQKLSKSFRQFISEGAATFNSSQRRR